MQEQQRMELVPIHDTGQELRTIQKLASMHHFPNRTTEASSLQGSQSLPTTSQARIQTSASPSLYAFNSCQVLRNSSALDGEARTWACITSLRTLSIAIVYSREALEPTEI